tara:strand:- start:149 stop:556 length:408 start_codon:yes stop_codon:yes gene_type:complete
MSKIDLILQMIKAGVAAPKIIAKYGKKLYKKVKADMKETDRVDIANKEWIKTNTLLKAGIANIAAMPLMQSVGKHLTKKEKEERAVIREEARKPKKAKVQEVPPSKRGLQKRGLRSGGAVNSRAIAKKYFKGGMV